VAGYIHGISGYLRVVNMSVQQKDLMILDSYLTSGIDMERRRIFFGNFNCNDDTFFDTTNVVTVLRAIQRMADVTNKKPIELHCYSYGGDIYSALALVDMIEHSGCDFHFYGWGAVMSAATLIMAVCKERYLSENTSVMVHELTSGSEGKATDLHIDTEENMKLQDRMAAIYARQTYPDVSFWETVLRRDLYLTPIEAVRLGLADKVLPRRRKSKSDKTVKNVDKKQFKALVTSIYKKLKIKAPSDIIIDIKDENLEVVPEYDNSEQVVTIEEQKHV